MIPVKLTLNNFMSYRDNVPSLFFNGIHTACISGDNGNGKSALIDAITWALWGHTRAKSDDDLVHIGETGMEVEFDFTVGQQSYRIIRKHARPKRRRASGQNSLDLFIINGNNFKAISGDSQRQTQQRIIDILHMDYDTFINSAFLRQGHADEFTRQPPTRRKQVLANILGLSLYDKFEDQAKDLARQGEMAKVQLESSLREIAEELSQESVYQAELDGAQRVLIGIEEVMKEQGSQLNRHRQERELLESKKRQLTQLEESITMTKTDRERWQQQMKQHRSRFDEFEKLISRCSAIEEGYAQFIEVKKLCDEYNRKLVLLLKLNERKGQLEKVVEKSQAALITEHAVAQSRINELEVGLQKLPQLKSRLIRAHSNLRQVHEREKALRSKNDGSQELRSRVHALSLGKVQLEREKKELEDKIDLLSAQGEARCPLCEAELSIEGRQRIEAKYSTERDGKSACLETNQTELIGREVELKSLERDISQMEVKLNQDAVFWHGEINIIGEKIAESEEATSKLNEEKIRLSGIEQRLVQKDFSVAEQLILTEVGDELAGIGYDSQVHEQIRQRVVSLEKYEECKQRLDEATKFVKAEKEAFSWAEEVVQKLDHNLEIDTGERQALAAELLLLPQLVDTLGRAEAEHQALSEQQRQAQEVMGSVKGKLQRCYELETKKQEKEKLFGQALEQESVYKELAKAFGKNGVQAMLIETALPEIEDEANRLLRRMTDNRMHVKIETQGETKKGDVIETLDIHIADELGTRNYEMFSGGEAFRINFAIRIALSKLLAKRHGAPLPTLIIDEGFGTQDGSGIEKLKEAINTIREDFEKILVITHVEELRDAFPARIDIIKTTQGSTLEIN
ncbi:AAA family ATPase [Chloroflexota bacterium]